MEDNENKGNRPKWMNKTKAEAPTRKNSEKQEKRLAKEFGGRKTANSGATFGQNDVITPNYDIEAKTTKSKQYILKVDELRKMQRRTGIGRTALFIIEFSEEGEEVVLMNKADFLTLAGLTKL